MKQTKQLKKARDLRRILMARPCYDRFDKAANVTDLLADIRLYCEQYGVDYHNAERVSYQHYLAEKDKL